jgi:dCMP deaminase
MGSNKWDQRFLKLAAFIAQWSKDRSTKVGAVVVGPDREIRSVGYNGFPRGVNDDIKERHERPAKYKWVEHAERNSLFNAVRFGAPLAGCTLYCTHPPCTDCARAIIQSGIESVVVPRITGELLDRWVENFEIAATMILEAGYAYRQVTL